ncbi:hypothetical protein [Absidia glauca]|uniref:MSP domain-containing protein n=1 Tax=Absidia glauca TaxID=4829 RepID=A0A163KT35_ABSGL|nr:hypothetical protein [Absidia glauca]
MSVVLDPPSQLLFKRPLTQPIEHILHLQNVGTEPLAFKVKTTTPKQYCVKPNVGIIAPSSQAEVQVVFQPFAEEPAPDFKCKDKFLVQTAQVKSEWSELSIAQFWTLIEMDYQEVISRRKVKCVFLPPELPQEPFTTNDTPLHELAQHTRNGARSSINDRGGNMATTNDDDDPPSPTIPSTADSNFKSFYSTTKLFDPSVSTTSLFSTHTAIASTPVQQPPQRPLMTTPYYPTVSSAPSPAPPLPPPSPPNATLLQQLRDENDQLQQQLAAVRSHNSSLGQQLTKEQSELKSAHVLTERLQQKIKLLETAPLTTTAAMRSSQLPVDGYPPQVLLSVSALVFIATLLFF